MIRITALLLAILALAAPAAAQERPERRFGLPEGRTLERSSYVVVWNGRTRCPDVVAEYLTAERLAGSQKRDGLGFRSDPQIPREFRPVLAAYHKSGFDFGHLAAAANHKRTFDELADTFIISNACPQTHPFNDGPWGDVEQFTRDLASNPSIDAVWVYTGPAWWAMPGETLRIERLGEIWVPTHFWKVLVTAKPLAAWAWIMPGDARRNVDIDRFAVSINTIETITGLDLLAALPDGEEDVLEAQLHEPTSSTRK